MHKTGACLPKLGQADPLVQALVLDPWIESFRFSMMTNPNRINPNGQYIRKKSFVIQFNCGKRK